MKERGMIFNDEMVRAVLEGRKTQTRRMLSPRQLKMIDAAASIGECYPLESGHQHENSQSYYRECCPFGAVGDRLWVRETWNKYGGLLTYRADHDWINEMRKSTVCPAKWTPSIHMPRWASRITLEITGVRVERLNSISEADAKVEGTHWSDGKPNEMGLATELVVNAKEEFAHLWRSIYGEESWQANPFVWVIAFKRVEGE